MSSPRAHAWLLLAVTLATQVASAAPKTKTAAPARSGSGAAALSERSSAAAASDALQRHLADAGLADSLVGYAVTPSVAQLRRYVESKRVMLVCIVDLALRDEQGTLLATVSGSAKTSGASPREAIDSATHAAVARLPQALQALRNAPSAPMADARRQWEAPLR